MPPLESTALFQFLANTASPYRGKPAELRDAVSRWLGYIAQTFPHYTQHTVEHSQEIISQLSKLIFDQGNVSRAQIDLSPTEAYILIAASYLHDAGMVVSDAEKGALLRTGEWQDWTADGGGGAQRFATIESFRGGREPADETARNFLADVQLRHLISEFIRLSHHARAATLLVRHQSVLGRFALDDPLLRDTISSVCVAHGLSRRELDDDFRYPYNRDIQGDQVNVRLMAILLRLGDLLDLSSERACPLLMNAASPLPADSLVHWSQYQRIRHRSTTPAVIQVEAECLTGEEHRTLSDWCQWIVDEVDGSHALMAGATRHSGWRAPIAAIDGATPTIVVRPAPTATYIPKAWTFQLDEDEIVTRLVEDVSRESLLFVRELVQNALDATRCALYDDLRAVGGACPESPTEIDSRIRQQRPLTITVREETVSTDESEAPQRVHYVRIEDFGTGMSEDQITRFLLQIGRSFYTTADFRRSYPFAPSSRFGVGFLSVFRDSDHVVVETATRSALEASDGGVRLTLTGPRSYLLFERGDRSKQGTAITVRMRRPLTASITERLRELCRYCEIPIEVEEFGRESVIEPETAQDLMFDVGEVGEGEGRFELRAFPFGSSGIRGHLLVLAYVGADGSESWSAKDWAYGTYRTSHPAAELPRMPASIACVNGLVVAGGHSHEFTGVSRLDFRRPVAGLGLDRRPSSVSMFEDPDVRERWEALVATHLAEDRNPPGPTWIYRQSVMTSFPLGEFWDHVAATIPLWRNGLYDMATIAEVRDERVLSVLLYIVERNMPGESTTLAPPRLTSRQLTHEAGAPMLAAWEVNRFSSYALSEIFAGRGISATRRVGTRLMALDWSKDARPPKRWQWNINHFVVGPLQGNRVGFPVHRVGSYTNGAFLLNERSAFVKWLLRVRCASEDRESSIDGEQLEQLLELLKTPVRLEGFEVEELNRYLEGWRELDVEDGLKPPQGDLVEEQFVPPGSAGRSTLLRRRRTPQDQGRGGRR